MKRKLIPFVACLLGFLYLPGMSSLAQRSKEGPKKVNFRVMVSAPPDNVKGSFALTPLQGTQIRLNLSDGQSFSLVSSDEGMALFKGLPDGYEYMAEISDEGYVTAIYHGSITEKPVFPQEFYTLKKPADSAEEPAPFQDAGLADVEGFVTCPASFPLVSVPLA